MSPIRIGSLSNKIYFPKIKLKDLWCFKWVCKVILKKKSELFQGVYVEQDLEEIVLLN